MPAITFAVGTVIGFFISRFTLSKSERLDHKQRLYENGLAHKKEKEERYKQFTNAIQSYISKKQKKSKITLDDFQAISTAGDLYFGELKSIAIAIQGENIDKESRPTFVTSIVEALQKNILVYYNVLQAISDKIDAPYSGEFKRSNYECLFEVAEKYAPNEALPPVKI
ncbi:MAG: hypothetical protein AB7S92_22595 [Parvibaculaceae bacterium]